MKKEKGKNLPDRGQAFTFIVFPTMQKTRKSIAKKFKVTASGKVMRRTAGHRHFLRNRTQKQKRKAAQDRPCSPGVTKFVKIGAPRIF